MTKFLERKSHLQGVLWNATSGCLGSQSGLGDDENTLEFSQSFTSFGSSLKQLYFEVTS